MQDLTPQNSIECQREMFNLVFRWLYIKKSMLSLRKVMYHDVVMQHNCKYNGLLYFFGGSHCYFSCYFSLRDFRLHNKIDHRPWCFMSTLRAITPTAISRPAANNIPPARLHPSINDPDHRPACHDLLEPSWLGHTPSLFTVWRGWLLSSAGASSVVVEADTTLLLPHHTVD